MSIETQHPVILTVIKCPTQRGYSIRHNQANGWKGVVSYWFGWYRYKRDATEAANTLQTSYAG